jgi:putative ABC transport system permease protein
MFVTYLLRELRRRARQAIFIALGLALGVGLVITVTAASSGVKNAQAQVLHSLYGVGTDITVTQAPAAGSGRFGGFGFGFGGGTGTRPKAGTKINQNRVTTGQDGLIDASSVTTIGKLNNVAAASGALTLTDIKISLTIGSFGGFSGGSGGNSGGSGGSPSGRGNFKPPVTFSVSGVDLSTGALGPLASAKLTAGRTFTTADTTSNIAVVDSNYAAQNKIKVGSTVAIGDSAGQGTNFTVVGVVSTPSGTGSDFYIPLARAQALAGAKDKVNAVYVAAANSSQIGRVSKEIASLMPKATVTTASSLASEVTGSLTSAASLANTLGKWLAIAVLAAAFALAVLLTMSAVTRRVREFGTLKALGWRSQRVVGQVMGEALTIGVIGGIVGVGLGYLGSLLVGHFAPPLTAALGQTTGSATPGGGRVFTPGAGGPGSGAGGFAGGGAGGFRPGGGFGRLASDPTVTVHLSAPVTISIIGAAVLLAIIGGLIAGGFGSWRAASLRPAAALARVA